MGRGQRVVADQQFFIQLFTGAQAGENDLDVARRVPGVAHRQARQRHHALRQIQDLQRLAHVEQEHIAPFGHGTRLQHQLGGLGDGHEVARDLRVGHRDGAAHGDLVAKQRDHAAAGAQHVAKAHHRKACGAFPGSVRSIGTERCARRRSHGLQHHLGHPLGGAHDVGGPHGLVGGNQHEMAGPVLQRHPHHGQRAEDVVQNAFACIGLHHGHVLVRGGMVDGRGPVLAADVGHALLLRHVGQQGDQLAVVFALLRQRLQFVVDGVEREFAVVHQQQLPGLLAHDLPAQFAADAAARPGDQHHRALQVAAEQARVRGHGLTAQQVLDLQLLEVGDGDAPAGQVRQARQGADAHRQVPHAFDDLAAALACGAGQCEQYVGDVEPAHHIGECTRRVHAHAVDAAADLAGVVVHKAFEQVLAHVAQARCSLGPGVAGTVDQQAVRRVAAAARQGQPAQCAAGAHQQHEQQRLQDADAAGHALPLRREQAGQQQRAINRHGLAGGDERGDAGVAEDGAVQPQLGEDGKRERGGEPVGQPLHALRPVEGVQPQREREPHGGNAQAHVHGDHHQAFGCTGPAQDAVQHGLQKSRRVRTTRASPLIIAWVQCRCAPARRRPAPAEPAGCPAPSIAA